MKNYFIDNLDFIDNFIDNLDYLDFRFRLFYRQTLDHIVVNNIAD